jgi:heat shock protein HslJ
MFVAESLEGQPVTEGVESSIRFDAEGRATGSAGCNNFQGSYEVDGTSLSFGPMAVARKMCPPAVMDQESAFLQAIDRVTSFAWDDDRALLLMTDDGDPSRFLPVSSDDESEG